MSSSQEEEEPPIVQPEVCRILGMGANPKVRMKSAYEQIGEFRWRFSVRRGNNLDLY